MLSASLNKTFPSLFLPVTADMERCSVTITDPTPTLRPPHRSVWTRGSHCDDVLHVYAPLATSFQHGNGIRRRLAHRTDVVISNDDTFLPDVGAHFDVDPHLTHSYILRKDSPPQCSRFSQCSMTGVTKDVVCVTLSVGWCI